MKTVAQDQRVEVALVDHDQFDFGVELAKQANLLILFCDRALVEHRHLDEEVSGRQEEVRAKTAHGLTVFVPRERKLDGFVDPLYSVEAEQARKDTFAGVSKLRIFRDNNTGVPTARLLARCLVVHAVRVSFSDVTF